MKKTIFYLTLFLFACSTIKYNPINAMELINKINNNQHKSFACDICNKTFATEYNLDGHKIRIHTEIKTYPCNECPKFFVTQKQLTRHTNTHTGKKTYTCSTCSMKINDSSNFAQHIKMHTKKTAYSCPLCSKKFRYQQTHDKHIKTHNLAEVVIKKTAAIEKLAYLPYIPIESLPFEGSLQENSLTPHMPQLEWNNQ